jgi:hypothetical protein
MAGEGFAELTTGWVEEAVWVEEGGWTGCGDAAVLRPKRPIRCADQTEIPVSKNSRHDKMKSRRRAAPP